MQPLRVLASPDSGGDAGNPYIDQLSAALRAQGAIVVGFRRDLLLRRPDVVHVHWPITLVRWDRPAQAAADVAKVLGLLQLARRRGAVLVWTGHDTLPHEGLPTALHRFFFTRFTAMVDGVISLGDASLEVLRERWPVLRRTPSAIVPHGHYRDAYPAAPPRDEARRRLGLDLDGRVYLALGQVRPYKDLPALAATFSSCAHDDETLVIAGAVRSAALEAELRAAASSSRVRLDLGRVPEEEVAWWHAASDVCVLHYAPETTLNSGAALLGLSFDRPVVVRDSPAMRELGALVGDEWLVRVSGGVEDAVRAARAACTAGRPASAPLAELDWDRLGTATLAAYDTFRRR